MSSLFSLLRKQHPPTPTLFPYTTLFRSVEVLDAEAHAIEAQLSQHRDITVMDVARIELNRKITLGDATEAKAVGRSEEHTSELQSLRHLVCRLLLEKKKIYLNISTKIRT